METARQYPAPRRSHSVTNRRNSARRRAEEFDLLYSGNVFRCFLSVCLLPSLPWSHSSMIRGSTDRFASFVTGLVDSKIHGQRKTMFQRAVDLGLPASFVELRHEATHREPPSLVVLRKATQRSLEWLWENYWAGIDDVGYGPAVEGSDGVSERAMLAGILRQFSASAESAEPVRKKRKRDYQVSVAGELVSVCGLSGERIRLLSEVLFDESVVIDSGRK